MARKLYSSCDPNRIDVSISEWEPSKTSQEFADECDVNNIMARYQVTGVLPVNSRGEPHYFNWQDAPDNLQDALNALNEASSSFMALPAIVRKEFDNDPVKFTEFATKPDSIGKLREWGLAPQPAPEAPPVRVRVENPPEPPAEPKKPPVKP